MARLPTFLLLPRTFLPLLAAAAFAAPLVAQDPCTSRTDCVQKGYGFQDSRPVITIGEWGDTVRAGTQDVFIRILDDDGIEGSTISIAPTGGTVLGHQNWDWHNVIREFRQTGTATLAPGQNGITVSACDKTGKCSSAQMSTVYVPPPPPAPRAAPAVRNLYAAENRNLATCDGCSEAVLTYSTPAYVSRDQSRAVTLFYSSHQANPRGYVEVEVFDASSLPADHMEMVVTGAASDVVSWTYHQGGAGAGRLAASFPVSVNLPSGMYSYTVSVTSRWNTGEALTTSIPVRVPIVNEIHSRFGKGWTIVGMERLFVQSDGVMLDDGAGGILWFEKVSCSDASNCTYRTPPGAASTLQLTGGTFRRHQPDGSEAFYHGTGFISLRRDRFGNQTTYSYDANLTRPLAITDPAGQSFVFGYHWSLYLATIQDPQGRTSHFWYKGVDLGFVYPPDNSLVMEMTYDGLARLTEWKDTRGGTWNVSYDAAHRLASVTAPPADPAQPAVRRSTVIQSREASVLPLPGTGTSPSNLGRRVVPDSARVRVTDPDGRKTVIQADEMGLARVISTPDGTTQIGRNARGQVTSFHGPGGSGTFAYDFGYPHRLTASTSAGTDGGVRLLYGYGAFGQLASLQVQDGNAFTYVLDGMGRRTHVIRSPADTLAVYTYDAFGRVTSHRDGEGHVTTLTYLPSGSQNLSTTTTDGLTAQLRYDALGRTVRTAAGGVVTDSLTYDVMNRVSSVRDRAGGTTTFSYGSGVQGGNGVDLHIVADALNQQYRYSRNALGMVTAEYRGTTQDSLRTIYDPATLLPAWTVNRRNQTVGFQYDSERRLSSRTADGQTTSWRYGKTPPVPGLDGRSWTVAENAVSYDSLVFDAEGKLKETHVRRGTINLVLRTAHITHEGIPRGDSLVITGPWGTTVTRFFHNSRGQLTAIRDGAGKSTTLHYNREGMLDSIRHPSVPVTRTAFEVDAKHRLSSAVSTASNLSHWYAYSTIGLVLRDTAENRLAGVYHEYEYDALDRISSWKLHRLKTTMACIPRGGCTTTTTDSLLQSRTFAWDAVGNPLGAPRDPGNRVRNHEGRWLNYDADGNIIKKYDVGWEQYLTWNSLNQLTGVSRAGGPSVTYQYDGFGRRVRRVDQLTGAVIHYVYHNDDLVLELDGAGNRIREYTYLPGIDRPFSMRQWANGAGGAVYYYQLQAPGHVNGLVDANGTVVNRYRYTPFGTPTNGYPIEGTPNPLQYMARELDAAVGLYYVRNRWYDPELGRFVSEDPIGLAGGINLHEYVGGNPISFRDPMGLCHDGGRLIASGYSTEPDVPYFGFWHRGEYMHKHSDPDGYFTICTPGRGLGGEVGQGVRNLGRGIGSYPRGVYRFGVHGARRYGFLGRCEQLRVAAEDVMLRHALRAVLENPGPTSDVVVRYAGENKAYMTGRVGTGLAASWLLTPIVGGPLSLTAGLGDARHELRHGRETLEDLVIASVGGSSAGITRCSN